MKEGFEDAVSCCLQISLFGSWFPSAIFGDGLLNQQLGFGACELTRTVVKTASFSFGQRPRIFGIFGRRWSWMKEICMNAMSGILFLYVEYFGNLFWNVLVFNDEICVCASNIYIYIYIHNFAHLYTYQLSLSFKSLQFIPVIPSFVTSSICRASPAMAGAESCTSFGAADAAPLENGWKWWSSQNGPGCGVNVAQVIPIPDIDLRCSWFFHGVLQVSCFNGLV